MMRLCPPRSRPSFLARAERADAVRADGLAAHGDEMRAFLERVLEAYVREGVSALRGEALAPALRLRYGGMQEARAALGEADAIRGAFLAMQSDLYRA